MKKSKGQREENSGAIWLACLKVMAVLFAFSLFSTAVWFRQRQYNPQEFGVDDLNDGSSGVFGAGETSRLAFSGSKQLAIPPGEFTFTQPGTTNPPDEFTIDLDLSPEVVEFEGFIHYGKPIDLSKHEPATADPPALLISGSKSIAMPILSTRPPRSAVSKEQQVLMSSSKMGFVFHPGEFRKTNFIGGHEIRVNPPDEFTIDLDFSPEVVEFEGFIHNGSPIDLSKNEPATADPPALLISGSKSIAMPILSTRLPRNKQDLYRNALVPASKPVMAFSFTEFNQWVTIGGETVRVVPPKFDVRLEGLILSNLSQFSVPGYLQAPADLWPDGWYPAGDSAYADTIPTGFRISIDPSVVAPPFLTIPDPYDDLRIQLRESVSIPN